MMKKYINSSILVCIISLGIIACSKDEIDTYSGTDALYFQWSVDGFTNSSDQRDSIPLSFAFDLPEVKDSVFLVPVKVLGNVSNSARPFSIEVLPTSTAVEGVDFTIPQKNLSIPADSIRAYVPITLLRTPEMKNASVSLQIGLVANEHFNIDYFGTSEDLTTNKPITYNEFEMTISDILLEPVGWTTRRGFIQSYLGDFSAKKLTLYAIVNNIPIPNWDVDVPNTSDFLGRTSILKRYLIEQKNNGTPILEEDGTEMQLGPNA